MRAAVVSLALLIPLPLLAGDPDDPVNIGDELYAGGLGLLTGLSWGSRGGANYLFVCNQTGDIRVIRNGTLQGGELDAGLTVRYSAGGELGLLNVMTDVDFGGANPYVYIFVSENATDQRVYRYEFSLSGTTVSLINKTRIGPRFPTANQNHNGGGLAQDSAGRIYVGVGNNNNGINEGGWQQTDEFTSLGSKVSRMDRNGNPLGAPAHLSQTGDRRYIWARGFRNPFGLRIRSGTDQLWMFEVGDFYEQIFHVTEDSNQGWVNNGTVQNNENNTNAANGRLTVKFAYPTGGSMGNCITRGTFTTGNHFTAEYQGIWFLEHNQSRIFQGRLSGDSVTNVRRVAFNANSPTDIAQGPDGALYYTSRSSGQVRRLYYTGSTPTVINTHPQDRTVNDGQSATFSVAASGNALSYQWQSSPDGTTFTNIGGAMSASYNTGAVNLSMNNRRYRVVVTGTGGTVTSNAATLTVNPNPPTINTQPASQSVVEGQTATFSVSATGSPTLSYQWQVSADGGANWSDVGGNSASYTTPAATLAMNGYRYRVIIDNPAPNTLTSNGLATLTVTGASSAPAITQGPASVTVTAPATATFNVTATGTAPLSYQWQRSTDGTNWTNVGTNASYTTPATTTAMSGDRYRVTVTNSLGSATSAAATLTVNGPAAATPVLQPGGGTYTGPVTVRISTASAGANLFYTINGGAQTAYAGPFVVSATATIQAFATGNGFSQSPTASASFTINGATPYGLPYRDVVSGITIPAQQTGLPTTLSGTGLFTAAGSLTARPGLVPFGVNSQLWSDGAAKRRWIALPGTSKITYNATGEWGFPTGTVLVKHFDLEISPGTFRRLETRVLRADGTGGGYGSTYRWRADGTDADLVNTAATEDIQVTDAGGTRTQRWFYPAPADCVSCHTTAAGFVLGPRTRQLNGTYAYPGGTSDNQLRTWNYLEMFATPISEAAIPGAQRLRPLSDVSATLEERVKSYLDSNCAHCHRPGAPSGRAVFDALYATPMASQGLINVMPSAEPLLTDPRIVAPQSVARSVLHSRMSRLDTYRMPTLASSEPDDEALVIFEAWINSLPLTPPPVSITVAPTSQAAVSGQTATFSVAATGAPPLSYQWQQSTNGGGSWTNIPGATGATYTTGATTAGMNGTMYRVVVTDGTGATATSAAATLTVAAAPPPPPPPAPEGDLREGLDEKCVGSVAAAPSLVWLAGLAALAYLGRRRRR